MNITPKSLIDSKEFAGDVRRSEAEGSAVPRTIPGNVFRESAAQWRGPAVAVRQWAETLG